MQTYVWPYLAALGQYDQAIAILSGAEQADPLNLRIKWLLGFCHNFAGEREEAINSLTAVLNAAPDHVFALVVLAQTHLNAGQLNKAKTPLTHLESMKAPNAYQYTVMERVELEVLRGNVAKAQSVYDEGRRIAESGANKSPSLWLTLGYAASGLGHLNEAVTLFNRSFEKGAFGIVYARSFVTSYPPYTQGHGPTLMADPDFQAFLAKMNLDDASIAALEAAEAGE